MAVVFQATSGTAATPRLIRRKDGVYSSIFAGSSFTIASGQTVRIVIGDRTWSAEEPKC